MINHLFLILILIFDIILYCLTKKFILLPYNSPLCNKTVLGIQKFYEFTISQSVDFEAYSNISGVSNYLQSANLSESYTYSDWSQVENMKYICRALVKPMGRELKLPDERGIYYFWNIRVRINKILPSPQCSDMLLLQFRDTHNLLSSLESYSTKTVNISCKDSLPIIIPSSIRKLYISYFSSDERNSGFLINVTSFILFDGDFSLQFQQDLCRRQDGLWCANESNVCIYRDLKCDNSDSCFDGGSDELNCPPNNWTNEKINPNPNIKKSTFIDYLPWLALGILPLILLMALVCICNQHRSEVFFDDDEDNLDIDKSQDDNADRVWSSLDAFDRPSEKINDCIEEELQENLFDNVKSQSHVTKEPLIGLQTTVCPATVKADISTSASKYSLIKDNEVVNDLPDGPKLEICIPESQYSINNENFDDKEKCNKTQELSQNPQCNPMTVSEIADDDYVLEDVGSLLRKVDKSKIPEEVRIKTSVSNNENIGKPVTDSAVDYRSDYILV